MISMEWRALFNEEYMSSQAKCYLIQTFMMHMYYHGQVLRYNMMIDVIEHVFFNKATGVCPSLHEVLNHSIK